MTQRHGEISNSKTGLCVGIRILNRAIDQQTTEEEIQMLRIFARGLALPDASDHKTLDVKGISLRETYLPSNSWL